MLKEKDKCKLVYIFEFFLFLNRKQLNLTGLAVGLDYVLGEIRTMLVVQGVNNNINFLSVAK